MCDLFRIGETCPAKDAVLNKPNGTSANCAHYLHACAQLHRCLIADERLQMCAGIPISETERERKWTQVFSHAVLAWTRTACIDKR